MALFGKKRAVGLDIGQSTVKAVALAMRGKRVVMLDSQVLDVRAEGILDDAELHTSVAEWLDQIGWAKEEFSVVLPQYLATTQVSDFPPGVTTGLEEMVAYETRQLAGLSEESFVHDYQVMAPKFGRKNPVLIGVCRESVVRERSEKLTSAGVCLGELSMNGLAVTNTLFHFHPEVLGLVGPQLLLDIGAESSTMIVIAGGQVLFVGSLLFGAHKYTQTLAKHLELDEAEAEKVKLRSCLNASDTQSPLYLATRQLESELRTAVEHWRAEERPEIANKMFDKVWLCGGGCQLKGLAEYFSRTYGCPVEIFGPTVKEGTSPAPALASAYGLALQDLEQSCMSISLCPPELTWQRLRRRRFGYLVAVSILATVFMGLFLTRSYQQLVVEQAALEARLAELQDCEMLIPGIEDTIAEIYHHEKMLIPFAAKGNRARRFLSAIKELSQARAKNDWFVYLADERSYQEGKKAEGEVKGKPTEKAVVKQPSDPLLAHRTVGGEEPEVPRAFEKVISVSEIEQLHSMVVAGYTRFQPHKPYEPVREIVRKLNREDAAGGEQERTGLFRDVDLLPEVECKGREDIFALWLKFFRNWPDKKYKPFTLRLPFDYLEVNRPDKEEK